MAGKGILFVILCANFCTVEYGSQSCKVGCRVDIQLSSDAIVAPIDYVSGISRHTILINIPNSDFLFTFQQPKCILFCTQFTLLSPENPTPKSHRSAVAFRRGYTFF